MHILSQHAIPSFHSCEYLYYGILGYATASSARWLQTFSKKPSFSIVWTKVDLHQNLNSVWAWRQAHRNKTFQTSVWRVWVQHNQLLGDELCKPGVGSLLLHAFPLGSGLKYYLWRKLCEVAAYMYFTSTIITILHIL